MIKFLSSLNALLSLTADVVYWPFHLDTSGMMYSKLSSNYI